MMISRVPPSALSDLHPVGFHNSATGADLGFYAARSYSLMRPPRTGRRWIRSRERSATGWSGRAGAGGAAAGWPRSPGTRQRRRRAQPDPAARLVEWASAGPDPHQPPRQARTCPGLMNTNLTSRVPQAIRLPYSRKIPLWLSGPSREAASRGASVLCYIPSRTGYVGTSRPVHLARCPVKHEQAGRAAPPVRGSVESHRAG
jgi:hypothetical protein